ncbi:diguanylate cyclase [Pseudomonas rhizosphaerae]|uniref:cyclic-guanylate-specific phosphodiesterase n=1 Tax=Pseudomonas rhizosphaerae TaxID=216142 RepID=A0A089YNB6_9PSED|nr:EAL domain-containing protein [Pseudomonas rhizosphaerae]AIS17064.1 diguanylate cyclase [Pseudomonas rhizosphaerae]
MLKSSFTSPASGARPASSTSLAQASLVTFCASLAVVFALAVSLSLYFARGLDSTEQAQGQSLVQKSIEAERRLLQLTIKDYSFWGEAYRHLHLTVDMEWAYVRENFGPALYDDFGYQAAFVIGPSNRSVYAVIDGKYETVAAADWLGRPVDEWVAAARGLADDEKVFTALTSLAGTPALVVAAAITPSTDPTVQADDRLPSVMLVVNRLDPQRLETLGANMGLQGVRMARPNDATAAHASLTGEHGTAFDLQWDAVRPGRQMIIVVLPLIVLTTLIIFGMTWVMLRRNTRAARALDGSHELLRNSQAALAQSESRFRDVAEASSDWIWETDCDGRVTYLSDRFEAVTGLDKAHWLGTCIDERVDLPDGSLLAWLRSNDGHCNLTTECSYVDVHLHRRTARIAARTIGVQGFRGTATDVTEEIEARRRVEYLSRHDVLTGLPNRSQLRDYLESRLENALAASQSLIMLTIDLDRFKPVNDLLGHATGDRVLYEIGARIRQCVRSQDIVARVGGDEFVMVVAGPIGHEEIEALCRRLIELIEQVIEVDDQDIHVSASIGIAVSPGDAAHAPELLRYSDIALYEAKASGRGTWRFYDGDMNARIVERRRLESDLRYAIKHGELRLHYQPRFRISDGQMVGAEALVRWQHPQRGLLAPDAFIPIAEDTGLITALGDWVMNAACRQASQWPEALFISVNVSSKEFQNGQLVERVKAALQRTGLTAARLELEVTESVMLEDADNALTLMRALKALGVRLAMDDFGTGYSSLSYLRSFPFDGLKIDRSFVSRLGDSQPDLAIIEAVIGLGRALSLTVTAEGVETQEHLRLLDSVACDEGQGYYLSRPLDGASFEELLLTACH